MRSPIKERRPRFDGCPSTHSQDLQLTTLIHYFTHENEDASQIMTRLGPDPQSKKIQQKTTKKPFFVLHFKGLIVALN